MFILGSYDIPEMFHFLLNHPVYQDNNFIYKRYKELILISNTEFGYLSEIITACSSRLSIAKPYFLKYSSIYSVKYLYLFYSCKVPFERFKIKSDLL